MDLISFISSIEVTPDNLVVENELDQESSFVSRFYTPHSAVSELARKVLENIQMNQIPTTVKRVKKESLAHHFIHSNFRETYPSLFKYIKILLLECFAIAYTIDYDPKLTKFLTQEDIQDTIETLKYILDVVSLDVRYPEIINGLHDLNVDLGYIKGQVPVIRSRASIKNQEQTQTQGGDTNE